MKRLTQMIRRHAPGLPLMARSMLKWQLRLGKRTTFFLQQTELCKPPFKLGTHLDQSDPQSSLLVFKKITIFSRTLLPARTGQMTHLSLPTFSLTIQCLRRKRTSRAVTLLGLKSNLMRNLWSISEDTRIVYPGFHHANLKS